VMLARCLCSRRLVALGLLVPSAVGCGSEGRPAGAASITAAQGFVNALVRGKPDSASRFVAPQFSELSSSLSDTSRLFVRWHAVQVARRSYGRDKAIFVFRGRQRIRGMKYLVLTSWTIRLVAENGSWGVRDYRTNQTVHARALVPSGIYVTCARALPARNDLSGTLLGRSVRRARHA